MATEDNKIRASSYNKFFAIVKRSTDSNPRQRLDRTEVSLKTDEEYARAMNQDPSMFPDLAGCDISNLFFPFTTHSGTSNYPRFLSGSNLIPYAISQTSGWVDRFANPSESDSMTDYVSGNIYGRSPNLRDPSNIRVLGLRLPIIGVGWGNTTDREPWPYADGDESKFVGNVPSGFQVDPLEYTAAPIDLRYNKRKNVWTCQEGFWAQITETSAGSGYVYSWIEKVPDSNGDFSTPPSPKSGSMDGDRPAYEVNHNGGVEDGEIVWMWPGELDDNGLPTFLFNAEGDMGYALEPCGDGPVIYTADDLESFFGLVVEVDGECYFVRAATKEEILCNELTCGLDIESQHEDCCSCNGFISLTVLNCDDLDHPEMAETFVVDSSEDPTVGDIVRLEGQCYLVVAVDPCDPEDNSDPVELEEGNIFSNCEECLGDCFDLTIACGHEGSSLAVRAPNIESGDIITVNGKCYTVSNRECTGSETDISVGDNEKFADCALCNTYRPCGEGDCRDKMFAVGSATGPTASDDAVAAAISAANSECGGRGINICFCPPPKLLDGETNLTQAIVCYDCCCPEGYEQVEIVIPPITCVDGNIEYDTEKRCMPSNNCVGECS